jgi:hypothetical protein
MLRDLWRLGLPFVGRPCARATASGPFATRQGRFLASDSRAIPYPSSRRDPLAWHGTAQLIFQIFYFFNRSWRVRRCRHINRASREDCPSSPSPCISLHLTASCFRPSRSRPDCGQDNADSAKYAVGEGAAAKRPTSGDDLPPCFWRQMPAGGRAGKTPASALYSPQAAIGEEERALATLCPVLQSSLQPPWCGNQNERERRRRANKLFLVR